MSWAGVEIVAKQPVKYKVRSLLEPEITVTGPLGDRSKPSKTGGVHPHTSFDETASGINTPMDSDTEADITDIKRAQKLAVNTTKIMSTPSTGRCVQTIYRGDFGKMQQEAHDNQRRVRKYLVATDLSDEAAHALEWTIGTVLRDGDTLLAIYCVDEEVGIANDNSGDDAHLQEQALAVAESTKSLYSTPQLIPVLIPSPLGPGTKLETDSANASPAGRERGKAEQERYRAVQDIAGRVSKLLSKTKLQVKVVIEVIHCKSPKHLITEVIDFISPTLVILGSRGRSALKGFVTPSIYQKFLVLTCISALYWGPFQTTWLQNPQSLLWWLANVFANIPNISVQRSNLRTTYQHHPAGLHTQGSTRSPHYLASRCQIAFLSCISFSYILT